MRIEVKKLKTGFYALYIEGELILKHEKLSSIVKKIEEYLKLRFLDSVSKSPLDKMEEFFG